MKAITLMHCLLAIGMATSCTKDDKQQIAASTVTADTFIRDLTNGTVASEISGKPSNAEPIYFSLQTKKAVTATEEWDIAFTGMANTSISSNAKKGTWIYIANADYEKSLTRPSADFSVSESANSATSANGWYSYDMNSHLLTPVPAKTIFIKTGQDRVFKLAMLSIYKGAPQYPTSADKAPFLNFKFAEFIDR